MKKAEPFPPPTDVASDYIAAYLIKIPTYGKREDIDKLTEEVRRQLKVKFGDNISVTLYAAGPR